TLPSRNAGWPVPTADDVVHPVDTRKHGWRARTRWLLAGCALFVLAAATVHAAWKHAQAPAADAGDAVVAAPPAEAGATATTPPAVPGPTQDVAHGDDGFAFLRDRTVLKPRYGKLPALHEVRVDDATGARIRRVSTGGLVVYSRYTPASIDNRLVVVHGEDSTSARIEDLATGKVVRNLPDIGEVNEIRWHYGDDAPSRFYYVRGMQFRQMDARTGKDELVHDFSADAPTGDQLFTDVEGDSSDDSRYWCWMVRREVPQGSYPVDL